MELVSCPSCGQPAEIHWRTELTSTDGPVEHVKLRCLAGHTLLMPSIGLVDLVADAVQVDVRW